MHKSMIVARIALALALLLAGATQAATPFNCTVTCRIISDPFVTGPTPDACKLYDSGAFIVSAPLVANACDFTRTVAEGVTVNYTATAIYGVDESGFSNTVSFTSTAGTSPPPLPVPTNVHLESGGTTGGPTVLASESFAGPDQGPIGGNWSKMPGASIFDFKRQSNLLQTSSDNLVNWDYQNSVQFPDDQYAKMVLAQLPTNAEYGPSCRIGPVGALSGGYLFLVEGDTSTLDIYSYTGDGGAGYRYNVLARASWASKGYTPKLGDVLEIRAVGTSISGWVNGTQMLNASDSTFPSGKCGPWGYSLGGTPPGFSSFEVGAM
jgi:hypothetical protein